MQLMNVLKKQAELFLSLTWHLTNAILEPIAKGYNKLPNPIKNGTSNFTSNIATLLSIPNNLLSGKYQTIRSLQQEVF